VPEEAVAPQSYLRYRRFRWLGASLGLLVAALALYLGAPHPSGRNGGTPLGYALGSLCAVLVLWLAWFGVRKRRYHARGAPLRGWLSAHVYLGSTLLLLVPLHAGFQVGWNVHTLAYGLVVAVVASGLLGIGLYASVPPDMTRNRPGQKLRALLQQIADVDAECRVEAANLPDRLARAVAGAIDETRIGGGLWRQLSGRDPRCATGAALKALDRSPEEPDAEVDPAIRLRLVGLLALKQGLLRRVRRDARYKALLDLWLLLHVPLSIGALAAVAAHVLAVFYCW
jgi:hypothetical protein